MPPTPSDHLLDWKLETECCDNGFRHTFYVTGSTARDRRVRAEETWTRDRVLGEGSYGTVWVERCSHRSVNRPDPAPGKRAVKEMKKSVISGQTWDYIKELEAIVKFSHTRYVPYFVRTFGWWETETSVFIAMEYMPRGDLRQYMSRRFTAGETRQIISQVLEGIYFMHENGFAHRDLKPANILVESTSGDWLVKIADFGCSKRSQTGGTELRTVGIGTLAYMAPEVYGGFRRSGQAASYSETVDMWPIGVITYELLCHEHPFSDLASVSSYAADTNLFPTNRLVRQGVEDTCVNFIRGLMTPNPDERPTSSAARQHVWLVAAASEPTAEIPDSDNESEMPIDEAPHLGALSPSTQAYSESTTASLIWSQVGSTVPRTSSSVPSISTASTILSLSTVSEASTTQVPINVDRGFLAEPFRVLNLEMARYFVLRSNEERDIETSAALGIWTAGPTVNKRLDKAYRRANSDEPILLFFSVTQSRRFCGVARMTSWVDFEQTDPHWVEDTWVGRFTVDWIWLRETSFDHIGHIPVKNNPGYLMKSCYDGTEISRASGLEALTIFSTRT